MFLQKCKKIKTSAISVISIISAISLIMASLFFNVNKANSTTAPYFRLSAAQGQGVGSNEFYVGRCFRVDIYLNTGGHDTNGADVEINYNNSYLVPVQSNCSSAATSVYSDGLFDTYPSQGNSITVSKIYLSAYNNPGNSVNTTNGLYGHLFFRVASASSSYTLPFEYTQDLTTDTNLAETGGNGSDILVAVDNLTIKLVDDTDNPDITSQVPTNNATGVSISSNVTFNLYDAMSGIDSSSITGRMKKSGNSYYAQTVSLGTVLSTNQNRYYQYPGTINPNSNIKTNGGFYEYATTYYVEISTDDLATPSSHDVTETWSFTTEGDTTPPYVANKSPSDSATNVAVDTNVVFRVKDYKNNDGSTPGKGVDADSIEVSITSAGTGQHDYTCASSGVTCDDSNVNNVLVTINPALNFSENETVTVAIDASDSNSTPNAMTQETYSFTTADTAAPTISGFLPAIGSFGNASTTNVSFHLIDSGAGVAIETLQVYLNSTLYVTGDPDVTITGDASDYLVIINPTSNFTDNSSVATRISVRDQAPSLNYISPNPTLYSFIIGLSTSTPQNECPICATCQTCPTVSCGGGSTQVIYVEKECKNTTTTVYSSSCPTSATSPSVVTNNNSTISTPNSTNSSCQQIINVITTSSPTVKNIATISSSTLYSDFFINLKTLFNDNELNILADNGIRFDTSRLGTSVSLISINGLNEPSKSKFLSFDAGEKSITFKGHANVTEGSIVPIIIRSRLESGKTSPMVFHVYADKKGDFTLTIANILPTGNHLISSLLKEAGGKIVEKQLGTIEIKNTIKEKDATNPIMLLANITGASSQRFNILIYLIIAILCLLLTVFSSKPAVDKVGFASLLILAIVGAILTRLNVENLLRNKDINPLDINSQTAEVNPATIYNNLREQTKINYNTFIATAFDPVANKPLSNLTVEYKNQKITTDKDGKFVLQNVLSNSTLKITSSSFAEPIYVDTEDIVDKKINISSELWKTAVNLENQYRNRKFSAVYNLAATEVKKKISKDDFVNEKNNVLFGLMKQYTLADGNFLANATVIGDWKSSGTGKTYQNVIKMTYLHKAIEKQNKATARIMENWYFVNENGEWKFVM